jgi:hypothetical protein
MTVQKLIDILCKEVKEEDRENAEIEIWNGETEYYIESMSGFSISPDISIFIKPTGNNGISIKPMNYKKEHEETIKNKFEEIAKEINEK